MYNYVVIHLVSLIYIVKLKKKSVASPIVQFCVFFTFTQGHFIDKSCKNIKISKN